MTEQNRGNNQIGGKAFLLTEEMLDAIEKCPPKMRAELARLLFQYGMGESHGPCDNETMAILRPLENAIDAEQIRYNNKLVTKRFSRAIDYMIKSATNEHGKKEFCEMADALKQVYAEVTNHHVPNVFPLIVQCLGIDNFNNIRKNIYFSQQEIDSLRRLKIVAPNFSNELRQTSNPRPTQITATDPASCYRTVTKMEVKDNAEK